MIRRRTFKFLAVLSAVSVIWLAAFWIREAASERKRVLLKVSSGKAEPPLKLATEPTSRHISPSRSSPPKTFYNLADDIDYSPEVTLNLTLPQLAYDEIERDYFRYLMKIQFDCRHRIRAGTEETGDGGWEVCLDPPYNLKPGKCLVYSFGISYKWSFDDYMDQEKKCEVHAFDPSIGQDDFNRSANIHFHNLGLGGKNWTNAKKWKMYTLGSIVRLLGHKDRIIDYLKIDIEKSEWSSLEAMYQEGVLAQVKQLGIEFHDVPSNRKRVSIINRLYELGFRIYYTKQNFFQRKRSRLTRRTVYGCMESHFVNINFYERSEKS